MSTVVSQKLHYLSRRVARIWKRGGAILKEWEKCKRPWPEFSLFLNQFHTVCPKIETKFLGKFGNLKDFSAQNQVVSKKKKVFTEIETDFSAEIRNSKVFSAQNQVVSKKKKKKKKGLHRSCDWFFGQIRKFKRFRGAVFLWGGLFSIFHTKSASKAPKTCDFAYFTSQWGGSSPPASPLATLLYLSYWENTKVPPLSRPTVNLLNALVAQSIFCNYSGNNITAVSGNWNVLAIIVRPIFVLRFVKVQLAGHLWDLSQSSANARVSISPNKFRFCGWGIESQTFIIKFLCVTVIQNYQSGSKKKSVE